MNYLQAIQPARLSAPSGAISSLFVSSETESGTSLSWSGSASSYDIRYKPIGEENYRQVTQSGSSLVLNDLKPFLGFQWSVRESGTSGWIDGPLFCTKHLAATSSPILALPSPYYSALDVSTSIGQIALDFVHSIKLETTFVIELRTEAGTLVKSFFFSEVSVGGNWHNKLIIDNVPPLVEGETYSLIVFSGSIVDYETGAAWAGLDQGDYEFTAERTVFANEYYVDFLAGDDSNPGTSSLAAKKTLLAAWDLANGGDRINILAGVGRQQDITLPVKLNAKNPIYIQGAGKDLTTIRGSQQVTGWTLESGSIYRASFTGSVFASQQCWANGNHLLQIGDTSPYHPSGGAENQLPNTGTGLSDMVAGSFFHDLSAGLLYVWLPDNSDPNNALIECSRAWWVLETFGSEGIVIKDLTIEHDGRDSRGSNGILKPGSHTLIKNCGIHYGSFKCVNLGSAYDHIQIYDSEISFGGDVGLDANNGSSDGPNSDMFIHVDNCHVHDCNYRGFNYDWHSGGFKLIPGSKQVHITDSLWEETNGPLIWPDGSRGQHLIEGNICIGHSDPSKLGQGIFYEVPNMEADLNFACVIRNNIVRDSRRQGIYISAANDAECYNNTLINCWAAIVVHGQPRLIPNGQVLTSDNNTVFNNIVENNNQNFHAHTVTYTGNDSTGAPTTGTAWDYNFYHTANEGDTTPRHAVTTSGDYAWNYDAVGPSSAVCSIEGFNCNSESGDAGFVDYNSQDFRIVLAGAPAWGQGYFN